MKILIFTEGTCLMHQSAKDVSREERVKQSQQAGVQGEENALAYETDTPALRIEPGSVDDFASYIPVGNAAEKLTTWKKQGATICYLTSRRIKNEVDTIRSVLQKYHFPDTQNLFFRKQGEEYKDIAEKILPDVLIEDDCESIGGEVEMTYPDIRPEIKKKMKSVVVKEFAGIDHLPHTIAELKITSN
jgi:hypothetical protein